MKKAVIIGGAALLARRFLSFGQSDATEDAPTPETREQAAA